VTPMPNRIAAVDTDQWNLDAGISIPTICRVCVCTSCVDQSTRRLRLLLCTPLPASTHQHKSGAHLPIENIHPPTHVAHKAVLLPAGISRSATSDLHLCLPPSVPVPLPLLFVYELTGQLTHMTGGVGCPAHKIADDLFLAPFIRVRVDRTTHSYDRGVGCPAHKIADDLFPWINVLGTGGVNLQHACTGYRNLAP